MTENTFISLDFDFLLVVNCESTSLEKVSNVGSDFDLTRVRTSDIMTEGRERSDVTAHGFDGESGGGLREEVKEVRVVKDDRSEGSRDCSSVENSETFLRLERDGGDVVESESFGRRENLLATISNDANLDVRVTSEGSGDVREGREISRSRDGTTKGNDGKNVVVDQGDESFEYRPSNSRVTTTSEVQSQYSSISESESEDCEHTEGESWHE